ncbi:MAG: hypothetical protein RLZZ81_840 [Pseudomonadota bacterium]|jgi:hypothetical protein
MPKLNYDINAHWEYNIPARYNYLKVNVRNFTDTDVDRPSISFDVSKIGSITGEIKATNFDAETTTSPVIKGSLASVLTAYSNTTLTFGVNFAVIEGIPKLPDNFTFEGKQIIIPEDLEPPTKPGAPVLTAAGPYHLSVKWESQVRTMLLW